MWTLYSFLARVARSVWKLFKMVVVIGLVLSLIQIAIVIPVVAWERWSGTEVPEAVLHGLCVVLFVNLLVLYAGRRRRARRAAGR